MPTPMSMSMSMPESGPEPVRKRSSGRKEPSNQ